jgi:hypothetical protein
MAEAIPLPFDRSAGASYSGQASIRRYTATQHERLLVCKVKLQSLLLYFRFLFCMLTGVGIKSEANYTNRQLATPSHMRRLV